MAIGKKCEIHAGYDRSRCTISQRAHQEISKCNRYVNHSQQYNALERVARNEMIDSCFFSQKWLHWLAVNLDKNTIPHEKTLVHYNGPTPPKGSGQHRYVFVVFKQTRDFDDKVQREIRNKFSSDSRGGFNIKSFVQEHGLGEAVAYNFFETETKWKISIIIFCIPKVMCAIKLIIDSRICINIIDDIEVTINIDFAIPKNKTFSLAVCRL